MTFSSSHGALRRISRRSVLGLGALAGLGSLVACATPAGPTAARSGTTAPEPTAPARIVTLDPFSTYNLLDLGLEPVAVQEGLESVINPKYADAYRTITKAGTYFEPNFEAIAASAPDLILASTGQGEFETELAKVATTVLITGTTSSTWRQAAGEVATAVRRTEQMAELEKAYETRAAEIKQNRAAVLDSYTWAMVWQGKAESFSLRSAKSNGGQVLELAGVKYNAATQKADGDADTVLSWEQIEQLRDADAICLPGTTTGAPNEATELIKATKVFQSLPAAKAGRVFVFDYMTPGSYLNATQLLEEFDAALGTLA